MGGGGSPPSSDGWARLPTAVRYSHRPDSSPSPPACTTAPQLGLCAALQGSAAGLNHVDGQTRLKAAVAHGTRWMWEFGTASAMVILESAATRKRTPPTYPIQLSHRTIVRQWQSRRGGRASLKSLHAWWEDHGCDDSITATACDSPKSAPPAAA